MGNTPSNTEGTESSGVVNVDEFGPLGCRWLFRYVGITWSAVRCCCFCRLPYERLDQNQEGIVIEDGKLHRAKSKGIYYINPLTSKLVPVDTRVRILEITQRPFVTRNGNVSIAPVVSFQVKDPATFLCIVENVEKFVTSATLKYMGASLANVEDPRDAVRKLQGKLLFEGNLDQNDPAQIADGPNGQDPRPGMDAFARYLFSYGIRVHWVECRNVIVRGDRAGSNAAGSNGAQH